MKDKIKEILEILNYYKTTGKEPTYCEELITTGELHTLLDYITTLQEENKKIRKMNKAKHKYAMNMEDNYINERYKNKKAIEIYENSSSIKYKQKRFMEDKTTADLMYEALQGDDNNVKD